MLVELTYVMDTSDNLCGNMSCPLDKCLAGLVLNVKKQNCANPSLCHSPLSLSFLFILSLL